MTASGVKRSAADLGLVRKPTTTILWLPNGTPEEVWAGRQRRAQQPLHDALSGNHDYLISERCACCGTIFEVVVIEILLWSL